MKKQLVLAAGLAVLAAPAFATKARLQALGEDVNGSQYISDNRNIFLNPATVNDHKDLVTFEWGATTNETETSAAPRAEGGVFFGHGNMVYGVQLGEESNTATLFRANSGLSDAASEEQNAFDIFVGGDAGIKWGASLLYSSSSADDESFGDTDDDTTTAQAARTDDVEQKAMRARLGVSQGLWNAFALISLKNEADDGTNEFKGDTGWTLGGGYLLNDYQLFAQYSNYKGDNADDEKLKLNNWTLGVARTMKLNDKAALFTKAAYTNTHCENEAKDGTEDADGSSNCFATEEQTDKALTATVGLEYDAASWLTLRGSVAQNIMGEREQGAKQTIEATAVNAGASLKFGDFNIDGVIGKGGNTNGGQLGTEEYLSRVSMTYKF